MYNSRFFILKLINFQKNPKRRENVDISTYGIPPITPSAHALCVH